MHDCKTVQDWIKVWGDPEAGSQRLADCPRCWPLRHDITAWSEAVSVCEGCRGAVDSGSMTDDVLDCSTCLASLGRLYETVDSLEHFDPSVASELLSAEELTGKLDTLPLTARIARVTDDLRYQQWGLAQRLLALSRKLWGSNLERAHEYAAVGVAVSDLLDPTTYHPLWVADLRAKARAYLANTYRILGEFRQAEREFLAAEEQLAHGTGQGRARAAVFSLKASLLADQKRFVEASLLLEFVMAHYALVDEDAEMGRTCLQLALVDAGRGEYRMAAAHCVRAQAYLDPDEDPMLWTLAQQNAADFTLSAGDVVRAREMFDALPPAVGRSMELRRLWIEGNLFRAEGAYGAARVAYGAARSGMAQDGRHYLAALVSLEEAALALDEGDHFDAIAMAQEASILLVRGAARQEALAVLRVLLTALERGAADRALVTTLARKIAALQPSG